MAIIGAGIGGLYLGYKLKDKYEITIFEKEKEIGGLLGSFKLGGKYLEKTYHHIFKSDKYILELINELGLGEIMQWRKENMAVYYQNNLYAFNSPIDLLNFLPLNISDKIRLGLVSIYLQKENNFKKFEHVKAYEWLPKYFGKNVWEVLWKPLLKGKFGKYYKDIDMTWFWARIHFRGHSELGYLRGGFGQIIEKLSANLTIIHKEINKRDYKNYDLIIDTSPIKSVEYLGAVDVCFTSKQNLSKFYWHNINDLKAPFIAFIQHSNFVNDYGKHVYYMGGYYPSNHKYFRVKDEIIYKEFFGYLKKMFKDFEEKEVEEKYIFKFKYAQHIPDKSLLTKRVPPTNVGEEEIYSFDKLNPPSLRATPFIKGDCPVIHMNFAQIYPQDRGINYAIRQAKEVASSFR